jgi:hypothetical protein
MKKILKASLILMIIIQAITAQAQEHLRIPQNESFSRRKSFTSNNGLFTLNFQKDGNLVIYRVRDKKPLWASSTGSKNAFSCIFQSDGNLVIYDLDKNALWSSGTEGRGSYLQLQNDGNLVIYNDINVALWASNTSDPSLQRR